MKRGDYLTTATASKSNSSLVKLAGGFIKGIRSNCQGRKILIIWLERFLPEPKRHLFSVRNYEL